MPQLSAVVLAPSVVNPAVWAVACEVHDVPAGQGGAPTAASLLAAADKAIFAQSADASVDAAATTKSRVFVQPAPWYPVLPMASSTSDKGDEGELPIPADFGSALAAVVVRYPAESCIVPGDPTFAYNASDAFNVNASHSARAHDDVDDREETQWSTGLFD